MFLALLQLAGLIRLAVLDSAGMAIWHWYSTHTNTLVYHAHTRVAIWHWYTTHTHTGIPHTRTSISFARSTHLHTHARIHTNTQTQTYTHLQSLTFNYSVGDNCELEKRFCSDSIHTQTYKYVSLLCMYTQPNAREHIQTHNTH